MDSVEYVFKLCETRNVAISRLEKDLGFGNGYFKSLKRGKIPVDRAAKIAEYFNVPIESFTEETEKPARDTPDGIDEQLIAALADVTDSEKEKVLAYLAGLKANRGT